MRRFRGAPRAPLAVAGLLATPLLFASLMATSLALERPQVFEWTRAGALIRTYHPPTNAIEARIWLFALAVPAALVVAGAGAMLVRHGLHAVVAAAIVLALALRVRLDRWTEHHAQRFPDGLDLLPEANPSNTLSRGQWEASAAQTVRELTTATIALALAVAGVALLAAARRRRALARTERADGPGVHAPGATRPDVP